MSRRSKGFKRMIWVCPNCQARNPGPEATCLQCGAPQPPEVDFILPAVADFVQDEAELARARLGPDLICPYCGARNPASNEACQQCSAPLDEAARRKAGAIARQEAPAAALTCSACGAGNPLGTSQCAQCGAPLGAGPDAQTASPPPAAAAAAPKKKRKFLLPALLLVLLACCGLFYALFMRPARTVTAQVSDVYWRTTVAVEEMQPVRYTNQRGEPPSEAYNVSCRVETTQVCEETTVDRGNGYAEVVEECHDEQEQVCSYTLDEWQLVDEYPLEGHTLEPRYAQPSLRPDQRQRKSLTLAVTFETGDERLPYTPESLAEFQRYQIGSTWQLTLNALGGVLAVSPP